MATQENTPPTPPRTEAEFTAVLEDIRSQFKVFGEALQGLREHVDHRFDQVDGRFEQVDSRLAQLDGRADQADGRLGRIENAIVEHGREIKQLRGGLEAVRGEVGEVRATVTRIEIALATKVDCDEVESIVKRVAAAQ